MLFRIALLTLLATSIFITQTTLAEDNHENLQEREMIAGELGTREFYNSLSIFTTDIQNTKNIKNAFHQIIVVAIYHLKDAGFTKEALEIENEWAIIKEKYFNHSVETLELGDHKPINKWVAKTYNKIEKKLGKKFCKLTHLDDIKSINYGYYVTVHPSENPMTHADWGVKEYSLHFVPFTTAVSYWAGNMACSVAMNIIGSLVCSIALEVPRFAYEKFIAPQLAKDVYFRHNE